MKRWRLKPDVDFDSLLKFGFKYKYGISYTRPSVKKSELGRSQSMGTLFISGPNTEYPRLISLLVGYEKVGPYIPDLIEAGLVEEYEEENK
jgi:hypothetical protein